MGYPWFEATARRALNVFEILFFRAPYEFRSERPLVVST